MEAWKMARLGDICQIKPPKKETRQGLSDTDRVSFVPMADLGKMQKELAPVQEKALREVSGSYTYFAHNDVLLAKITPCFENGKLGIARNLRNGVGFGSSEFIVLRSRGSVDPEYLLYFLSQEAFRRSGARAMTGAVGHKRVPKEFIENLTVPLPPVPEQKRIVAILDEAFAAIETATANAEKNLANARELFDAFLHAGLTSNTQKWPRRTLTELLGLGWIIHHMDGNHGGDYPRKHEFIDRGVPYISAKCIADDSIDMEKAKYLSSERAARLRKGFAQDGDVLFAHNATVGPVAILKTCCETVILSTSLTYYRCDPEFICPQYLAHYMRSSEFVRQYELVMRQSTRNQVPITKQREFTHVVPPVEDQRAIAATLDDVRSRVSSLGRAYHARAALLTELKQSILNKAFTGELTSDCNAADRALSETSV